MVKLIYILKQFAFIFFIWQIATGLSYYGDKGTLLKPAIDPDGTHVVPVFKQHTVV